MEQKTWFAIEQNKTIFKVETNKFLLDKTARFYPSSNILRIAAPTRGAAIELFKKEGYRMLGG